MAQTPALGLKHRATPAHRREPTSSSALDSQNLRRAGKIIAAPSSSAVNYSAKTQRPPSLMFHGHARASKERRYRAERATFNPQRPTCPDTKRPASSFDKAGHNTGDNLLSHPSVGALPSAVTGLTSVFEKGTCVSLHLWSPEWCA